MYPIFFKNQGKFDDWYVREIFKDISDHKRKKQFLNQIIESNFCISVSYLDFRGMHLSTEHN